MTKTELEVFRQQLLKLKQRLVDEVDTLDNETFHKKDGIATGNLSNNPVEDRADLASDINSQDATLGLVENECAQEDEIDAALDRIKDGGFGNCQECGRAIASHRLQAIPFARQCIDCARTAQRDGAPRGNL